MYFQISKTISWAQKLYCHHYVSQIDYFKTLIPWIHEILLVFFFPFLKKVSLVSSDNTKNSNIFFRLFKALNKAEEEELEFNIRTLICMQYSIKRRN